jgi:hypothetical protein
MLYPICNVLYAGCHRPRLVCRFIYVECHVLVAASLQSDRLYAYLSISFCMLYARYRMPVTVYLHLYAGTWVPSSSLWVAKLAYMSNCYISVYMPSALFQELCAKCYGLYAKLHMLDSYMPSALFQELCAKCYGLYAKLHMLDSYMPNAMTIPMSFSMTTEQVGYLIIYMYITRLWLSILPLQEEIAIIPPGFQFISQSLRYFSMPAYQGKEPNFSMPAYVPFLYPGQHTLYPG